MRPGGGSSPASRSTFPASSWPADPRPRRRRRRLRAQALGRRRPDVLAPAVHRPRPGLPAPLAAFSFPTESTGYVLLSGGRSPTADGGRSFSRAHDPARQRQRSPLHRALTCFTAGAGTSSGRTTGASRGHRSRPLQHPACDSSPQARSRSTPSGSSTPSRRASTPATRGNVVPVRCAVARARPASPAATSSTV